LLEKQNHTQTQPGKMAFGKMTKTGAYSKRYQVQYRRRREGKTDYYARKRLVTQDKNKYNSPKYRFVVRFTNKDITCQFVYSLISGDVVMCAAYEHELARFGMPVRSTNYAAAYATGLLCARRLLQKLKLDAAYEGNTDNVGDDYFVEENDDGPRPFMAALDIGLARATTGAKLFAAMKGCADAGVEIPHSEKRFVGYDDESKSLDSDLLRKYIFGGHVSDYMTLLKEENATKYEKQFSKYIAAEITPETVEDTWKKVHAAIRADPSAKITEKKETVKKNFKTARRSYAQRKARINQKLAYHARKQEQA
jgi:large subunit ribosomal protein L5e